MPLPRWTAAINRETFNRAIRPLQGRVGPLAEIHHQGRRSGKRYVTPVFAFRSGQRFIIPLTFGRTDWARNILATGSGTIIYRGVDWRFDTPVILVSEPDDLPLPRMIRFNLHRFRINEFLVVHFRAAVR